MSAFIGQQRPQSVFSKRDALKRDVKRQEKNKFRGGATSSMLGGGGLTSTSSRPSLLGG